MYAGLYTLEKYQTEEILFSTALGIVVYVMCMSIDGILLRWSMKIGCYKIIIETFHFQTINSVFEVVLFYQHMDLYNKSALNTVQGVTCHVEAF